MIVPDPPHPFTPAIETLAAGASLYRVHGNTRGPAEFNASARGSTRFAFFGNPAVPVLYAAETEQAAFAETLLHDVPATGGVLAADSYQSKVLNRLTTMRPLRLVAFHGLGLRQLRATAAQLTDTERDQYRQTVRWAEASHALSGNPIDGIVWMSRRCNSDRAFVLFGDRVDEKDFTLDTSHGRVFADTAGIGWLSDLCAPLGVDVLHE